MAPECFGSIYFPKKTGGNSQAPSRFVIVKTRLRVFPLIPSISGGFFVFIRGTKTPRLYRLCDEAKKRFGYLGVEPKIGVKPPKWMVKIMEHPIKMDDLGAHPYFWKHPFVHISLLWHGNGNWREVLIFIHIVYLGFYVFNSSMLFSVTDVLNWLRGWERNVICCFGVPLN